MLYRIRQFAVALNPRLSAEDISLAREQLTPEQFSLFAAMCPVDQRHCLDVAKACLAQRPADSLLIQAALLHDCGKAGSGITLADRVVAVMAAAVLPSDTASVEDTQEPPASRWRRALYIRNTHAALGAKKLQGIGSAPDLVWLIRHHHARPAPPASDRQLARHALLAAADDRY